MDSRTKSSSSNEVSVPPRSSRHWRRAYRSGSRGRTLNRRTSTPSSSRAPSGWWSPQPEAWSRAHVVRTSTGTPRRWSARTVARHSASAPPGIAAPYHGTTNASVSGTEPLQGVDEPRGHRGPRVLGLHVGAAARAQLGAAAPVLQQEIEGGGELVEVLEAQPAAGPRHVVHGHRAAGV